MGVSRDHTHEQIRACARVLALQEGRGEGVITNSAPLSFSEAIIIIIIDIHTRQGAIHEKEEREKEDSREAGSVDQWPAGLCPVANRGLKGSWTDHWPTHVQHRNKKCDIYN